MKRPGPFKPFAKKSLGQNFLVDSRYISRILDAMDIRPTDRIFEIGPGRGALTKSLVGAGAEIIAIELDRDLISDLRNEFGGASNLTVVEADALEYDFRAAIEHEPERKVKLVANLPYYISTAILQHLIEQRHVFSSMVLMFQKEVVERIAARPGNSERGYLTVLVEAFFSVEKLFDVPPSAFRPPPKVQSSVVRITPKSKSIPNELLFRTILSSAFRQKRKTILNNLKLSFENASDILSAAGIDRALRPEDLTLDNWIEISRVADNSAGLT